MKKRVLFLSTLFIIFIIPPRVDAIDMAGEYTLPYPSTMPGGTAYKIAKLIEKVEDYWHFGNFSQFEYHLALSDKYLVQAKTLFEYRQYLLAYNALLDSDAHFQQLPSLLSAAKGESKDITGYKSILQKASGKHREVLESLLKETPNRFNWTPEKAAASDLPIHDTVRNAIKIRTSI